VEVLFVGGMMYEVPLPSFVAGIVAFQVSSTLGITYFHETLRFVPVFSSLFFIKVCAAGIFFGLCSLLLIEILRLFERLGHGLKIWPPLKGLLGGTFLVILTFLFSNRYLGLGLDTIKDSLEGVIESCVNQVGVDINTASVPLLRYVSGLNPLVAREIVGTYGGTAALAVGATTGITGAIAAARIGGGWLVDRFAVPHVMCAAHALALSGGLLLTLFPAPVTAVLGLGMVGIGYGFISGSTAGGIGIYWQPADYGRVAGRTYVAWCLAAISLPVLAGYLFDRTGGYGTPVLIAAGANLAGMAVALTMPRRGPRIPLAR
jgi:H+/Cl- antiporter ClcA